MRTLSLSSSTLQFFGATLTMSWARRSGIDTSARKTTKHMTTVLTFIAYSPSPRCIEHTLTLGQKQSPHANQDKVSGANHLEIWTARATEYAALAYQLIDKRCSLRIVAFRSVWKRCMHQCPPRCRPQRQRPYHRPARQDKRARQKAQAAFHPIRAGSVPSRFERFRRLAVQIRRQTIQ